MHPFDHGGPWHAVLLVAEGRVALSMRFPGRPEVAMLTVGSGEMLGWSGLKPGARRVASGRVVEAVTLLEFPAAALHALCEADHDVGYALMRFGFEEVSLRLHDTRLQLLDMFARQDA
jgi:CRP-like cAMP-binding protein